jgi:hypothetical protein
MSNTFSSNITTYEKPFLSRKELAFVCRVSLSTLARGIRDARWPYCAYVRISPRRIVYPASLVKEIEEKAGIQAGLKKEVE